MNDEQSLNNSICLLEQNESIEETEKKNNSNQEFDLLCLTSLDTVLNYIIQYYTVVFRKKHKIYKNSSNEKINELINEYNNLKIESLGKVVGLNDTIKTYFSIPDNKNIDEFTIERILKSEFLVKMKIYHQKLLSTK